MSIGIGPSIASFAKGAIRWAAVGSSRPTSSFAMCDSNAQEPGGMRQTATRCWRCAAPSITAHSIKCLCGINSGYGKRKNDRMLLTEVASILRQRTAEQCRNGERRHGIQLTYSWQEFLSKQEA